MSSNLAVEAAPQAMAAEPESDPGGDGVGAGDSAAESVQDPGNGSPGSGPGDWKQETAAASPSGAVACDVAATVEAPGAGAGGPVEDCAVAESLEDIAEGSLEKDESLPAAAAAAAAAAAVAAEENTKGSVGSDNGDQKQESGGVAQKVCAAAVREQSEEGTSCDAEEKKFARPEGGSTEAACEALEQMTEVLSENDQSLANEHAPVGTSEAGSSVGVAKESTEEFLDFGNGDRRQEVDGGEGKSMATSGGASREDVGNMVIMEVSEEVVAGSLDKSLSLAEEDTRMDTSRGGSKAVITSEKVVNAEEMVVVVEDVTVTEVAREGVNSVVKVMESGFVAEKLTVSTDDHNQNSLQQAGSMTCVAETAPLVGLKDSRDESAAAGQASNATGSSNMSVEAAENKVVLQSAEEGHDVGDAEKLEVGGADAGSGMGVMEAETLDFMAGQGESTAASENSPAVVHEVMDDEIVNGLVVPDHGPSCPNQADTVCRESTTITEKNQSTLEPGQSDSLPADDTIFDQLDLIEKYPPILPAESSKLDSNPFNATPSGLGNGKENNNCVARDDQEIENMVTTAEVDSKVTEDVNPPVLEQQDDRAEVLEPVDEQISESGDKPANNHMDRTGGFGHRASYDLPPLDKDSFEVSDLVWGKIKSHPWWPGQIFDPMDASELALKYQKKDNFLVAYFGDNTFAWCDDSQLKPFLANFSQMEKQSSSDAFINSVNNALEEVSRRVLSGMSCSCLPEELYADSISRKVENTGVREGVTSSVVDRSEILTYFSPDKLLQYIKALAQSPGQGGHLLELVVASSQLTAFYRSKGYPELPLFQTGRAWTENDLEVSSSYNVILEEAATSDASPTHEKPKRGRGRPPKRKHPEEHGLNMSLPELTDKKVASNLINGAQMGNATAADDDLAPIVSGKRQLAMDFDDFDDSGSRKRRSLDSFGDSETKPTSPTFGSSFKIGDCIRRAASQLTGSPSILKSQSETVNKNVTETENGEFDVSSDDAAKEPTVEKRDKRRRMRRYHSSDPEEVLSQLCLAARDPMKGYSFLSTIISYFSDFRNYLVLTTTEANLGENVRGKRGRKRKVDILSAPEVDMTDHMQDSYWSGFSLTNIPISSLRRIKTNSWPRNRKRRLASEMLLLPSSNHLSASGKHLQVGLLSPTKQTPVIERSIIHVEEKIVGECKPTALILSFGGPNALPSETDLKRIFSRYGPLKDAETEVLRNISTAKVVFNKRADAEMAFSSAGKYGTFGPSLRSYRLVNFPLPLEISLSMSQGRKNPEAPTEERGLEVPAPEDAEVPSDSMQLETIPEASVEQVDTVEQSGQIGAVTEASVEVDTAEPSGQVEAVTEASVEQVDTVKQLQVDAAEPSGQVEAVIEASVEQVDAAEPSGQVEAVTEASVEQVDVVKQSGQIEAVTEASAEKVDAVKQTGQIEAVTEALLEQVDMIEQLRQVEAITEASVEVPSDAMQVEVVTEASAKDTTEQTIQVEPLTEAPVELLSDAMQVDSVTGNPEEAEVCPDAMQVDSVTGNPEEAEVHPDAIQVDDTTEASSEQVGAVEQTVQVKALPVVSLEVSSDTMQDEVVAEAPEEAELPSDILQVEAVTETSVEFPADTMRKDFVAEAPGEAEVPSDMLQVEAGTESSVEQVQVIEQTVQVEAPTEASVEVPSDSIPVGSPIAPSEKTEVPSANVQSEASVEQADMAEQTAQVKARTEASAGLVDKMEQITGVEALTEASAEAPSETIPVGTSIGVPEVAGLPSEPMQFGTSEQPDTVNRTVQFEAVTEASVEQVDTTEQTVQVQAEASIEQIDRTEQTVQVQGEASVEQVDMMKQTVQVQAEAAVEQVSTIEQSGQVEAVTEASVQQADTTEQTMQVQAEASVEQTDMTEQAVQAQTEASVEQVDTADQSVQAQAEASVEQVKTIEQSTQVEAVTEASVEQVDSMEQTVQVQAEASVEQIDMTEQILQVQAEASVEQVDTTEQTAHVQAEASVQQVSTIEQSGQVEAVTEASVEQTDTMEQTVQLQSEASAEKIDMAEQTAQGPAEASSNKVDTTEQTAPVQAEAFAEQVDMTEQTAHGQAEASVEHVSTIEQKGQVQAMTEAKIEQVVTIEETVVTEAVTEALPDEVDTIEQTS